MLLKILVLTCLVFLPLGDGIKLGGGRGGTRGSGLNLGGGGRIRKQHTRKPGKPYFLSLMYYFFQKCCGAYCVYYILVFI